MATVHFSKYQALENDFLVIGPERTGMRWTPGRVAAICHRRRGVGADGLILLGRRNSRGVPFRLYNADGSSAEWSGNGVRCAAAFLAGAKRESEFRLLTAAGAINLQVVARGNGRFLASFERPLPTVRPVLARERRPVPRRGTGPIPVDAGNPHWIYIVPNFDFTWEEIGRRAQTRTPRTHGVNVEFARVLKRNRIEMRIFERGVGPTPSSGSGALAAVAACMEYDLIDSTVRVLSPGGEQVAVIDDKRHSIRLTAVTHLVCSGNWKPNS